MYMILSCVIAYNHLILNTSQTMINQIQTAVPNLLKTTCINLNNCPLSIFLQNITLII